MSRYVYARRMKRRLPYIVMAAVLIVATLGAVAWAVLRSSRVQTVAETLKRQAAFSIYYPAHNPWGVTVDDSTAKYATVEGDSVLSFVVTINQKKVTISEQAYPDILIYDKLTGTFADQSVVGTPLGELTVGWPKDSPQNQAAVIKTGDTLIFAKPNHDLTSQEWQIVFKTLDKV